MIQNNMMYFWRIAFTYMIAMHHLFSIYGIGVGWYIGVDFFAIVSGYLLCNHIENNPTEHILSYCKKRFFYFIPIVFFSAIFKLAVESYYNSTSVNDIIIKIIQSIPEFLLINAYGLSPYLNHVDWYIQVLVIPSILLFYMYKQHKDFITSVFAPIACWLIYSLIFTRFHYAEGYTINGKSVEGIINWPLLRIFAGLCLGIFLHYISNFYQLKINKKFQFVPLLAFISVFILSYFYSKGNFEFMYILLLSIGIILGFSSHTNRFFYNKYIIYFSNLSIYIYLNHIVFRVIIRKTFEQFSLIAVLLYILSVTLFSWFFFICHDKIRKLIKGKLINE